MYRIVHDSLSRQERALALLRGLLEREYEMLVRRNTDGVAAEEFSIQELIRQLAVEKQLVIRTLGGVRVREFAAGRTEDEGAELMRLFGLIDAAEQHTSRQASRNAQLSLALLDQSARNLQELKRYAVPERATVYGRRGRMARPLHTEAALLSGRL